MPRSIGSRKAAPPCLVTVWFDWIWPWISFWALRFILVEFGSMGLLGAPGPGLPPVRALGGPLERSPSGLQNPGVPWTLRGSQLSWG